MRIGHYKTAIIILALLEVSLFLINACFYRDHLLEDLASGSMTEVAGIIITLFLVDIITKKYEHDKERPRKKAYYRDIDVFYRRLSGFFSPPALTFIQEHKDELKKMPVFSLERLFYIEGNIDLWGDCKTAYSGEGLRKTIEVIKWYDIEIANIKTLGDRILDRYNASLPPELFGYISSIASDQTWWFITLSLQGIQHNKNIGASTNLPFLTQAMNWSEIFHSAITIEKWLICNKSLLSDAG